MIWLTFFTGFAGRVTGSYSAANWATAKANCEALGQRLMTIDSQKEDESFTTTLSPCVLLF